jgi:hypothetical protein
MPDKAPNNATKMEVDWLVADDELIAARELPDISLQRLWLNKLRILASIGLPGKNFSGKTCGALPSILRMMHRRSLALTICRLKRARQNCPACLLSTIERANASSELLQRTTASLS